jgi:hypothetical protein
MRSCDVASQARTDAVDALRDTWMASTRDLKTLAGATSEVRHELVSTWRDLKDVLMQAVRDLKDLGLASACQRESTAPTTGVTPTDAAAFDAAVKAIIEQAIKDIKAVVDGARTTAANAPKDSSDGANTDEDKDSHEGSQVQDEDGKMNDADDKDVEDTDDKDVTDEHASVKSKEKAANVAKATDVAKAASLKKAANLGKVKVKNENNRNNHNPERD